MVFPVLVRDDLVHEEESADSVLSDVMAHADKLVVMAHVGKSDVGNEAHVGKSDVDNEDHADDLEDMLGMKDKLDMTGMLDTLGMTDK